VIFRHAEHDEQLGALPVGRAELPERAADRVIPAAAMLTEQKPPCAAKLGVPNCCAQKPVSDCDWSRPVKKASFFGSVRPDLARRSVGEPSASSQLDLDLNSPEPRGAGAL
jgi:hypothetical protein